jgi:hypothetical protein
MAIQPTLYIVASDQTRNGKTMLARLLADYLLLDGRDPFLIDVDAPDGPLRNYFPGRTALTDFASIKGQMKLFDTVLASPGRDYVVDLPAKHTENFLSAARDLKVFDECHRLGFRVFLFFVVDESFASQRMAQALKATDGVDLFVPVRNMIVRSAWAEDGGALTIPFLSAPVAQAVSHRRFSFRQFVQGDMQGLAPGHVEELQNFLYETLNNISNLEPVYSLKTLKK